MTSQGSFASNQNVRTNFNEGATGSTGLNYSLSTFYNYGITKGTIVGTTLFSFIGSMYVLFVTLLSFASRAMLAEANTRILHSQAGNIDVDEYLDIKDTCRDKYKRRLKAEQIKRLKKSARKEATKRTIAHRNKRSTKQWKSESAALDRWSVTNMLVNRHKKRTKSVIERWSTFLDEAYLRNGGCDKYVHRLENIILSLVQLSEAKTPTALVAALVAAFKLQVPNFSIVGQLQEVLFGSTEIERIGLALLGLKREGNNLPLRELLGFESPSQVREKEKSRLLDQWRGLDKKQAAEKRTMKQRMELMGMQSEGIMCNLFRSESGEVIPTEEITAGVSDYIAGAQTLASSKIAGKLMGLMSMLLALGLLGDREDVEVNIGKLQLFKVEATKKTVSAYGLLDSMFSVGKFVCERGYQCFLAGSPYPLFLTEKGAVDFDRDCVKYIGHSECASLHQWSKTPWLDGRDYELGLHNLITFGETLVKALPKGEQPLVNRRLEQLIKLRTTYDLSKTSGGLRRAPFAFLVHGPSGIGKSTIINNLIHYNMKVIAADEGKPNFILEPNQICTLNESDKYHSDYRPFTQVVLLDDLANSKVGTTDSNPTVHLINFINNVKRTAVMAEAEMKGKIQIEPRIVCATTNVWGADWVRPYSNEPVSVLRRFSLHIDAVVKPAFQRRGTTMVDQAALAREAERGNYCPDAWNFRVVEFVGVNQDGKDHKAQLAVERELAKDLNFGELMEFMRPRILQHNKNQKSAVESTEEGGKIPMCSHGRLLTWCKECVGETAGISCQSCPLTNCEQRVSMLEMIEEFRRLENVPTNSLNAFERGRLEQLRTIISTPSYRSEAGAIVPLHEPVRSKWNIFNWSKISFSIIVFVAFCLCDFHTVKETVSQGIHYLNSKWVPIAREHGFIYDEDVVKFGWTLANKLFDIMLWVDLIVYLAFRELFLYSRDAVHREIINNPRICEAIVGRVRECWSWINTPFGALGIVSFGLIFAIRSYLRRATEVYLELDHFWRQLPELIEVYAKQFGLGLSFVMGFMALYKIWTHVRRFRKLASEGDDLTVKRDENNMWKQVAVEPLPDGILPGSNVEDLMTAVGKQLCSVVTIDPKGYERQRCNGLFVKSGILMIPQHLKLIEGYSLKIVMNEGKDGLPGKNFTSRVSKFVTENLDGAWISESLFSFRKEEPKPKCEHFDSDLQLVYFPQAGSMKDLTKFFPSEISKREMLTRFLYRTPEGKLTVERMKLRNFSPVDADSGRFTHGTHYQREEPSFNGLCMATHIRDAKNDSYIVGFHLAGTQEKFGMCAAEMVTKQHLESAIERLNANRLVVPMASEGTFETNQYGIDYAPAPYISPKSPARFQEEIAFDHYGMIDQFAVRPRTSVAPSILSDSVKEATGVENIYGPPANCRKGEDRIPPWQPYQEYLSSVGSCSHTMDPRILSWAVLDYTSAIDKALATDLGKKLLKEVRVLTDEEAINGVEGMSFVDPLKTNTSMGFPINKPKKEYMTILHNEDGTITRIMDERAVALAKKQEEVYRTGERCYPVFKACTKDEPTKLSKKKVRIFQAAPVSLSINVRKRFLTICHWFSNLPLITECAVGINSHGPAWTQLIEHVSKYGKERMVAGDFTAYDQNMSCHLTLLAYQILIHIAVASGNYTDDDIKIMQGIATDVCFPVINLNGELMQMHGTNPSGQNLTVYVNSIVNSLYQRYIYYAIYPMDQYTGVFQDHVALTTYGDDNLMSVSKDRPYYNHTTMQKEYAKIGLTYTMADKESESVPYLPLEKTDFLKRKSRFDPNYVFEENGQQYRGMYLALLDETAIFKSLHCNAVSASATRDEVALSCLESAMSEWFLYGESVYEARRKQMTHVVELMEYQNLIGTTLMPYSVRESLWMENYGIKKLAPSCLNPTGNGAPIVTDLPLTEMGNQVSGGGNDS
jgi:hypothetical protein